MKTKLFYPICMAIILVFYAVNLQAQAPMWKAPDSASTVKNPLAGNADAIVAGKQLFSQMCAVCHGAKGKGDGIGGMGLNIKPANFTLDYVQNQTDGAIYWKMTTGQPPMASYKDVLSDEQRWQLVDYIRTFKKVKK